MGTKRLTKAASALATVLVLTSVACSTGDGDEGSQPTTKPTPVVAFDSAQLPLPVSRLQATDSRLVYFALTSEDTLEQVGVDIGARKVAWRAPATRSYRPNGVGIDNRVVGDTAFRWEPGNEADASLVLHAVSTSDGRSLWKTPVAGLPLELPIACGEDLCVFGKDATVVLARATGAIKERVPTQGRVIGDNDDQSLLLAVEAGGKSSVPSGKVVGLARHGREVAWTSTTSALFAGASVSPDAGWQAEPAPSDGWVVWLGSTFERGVDLRPLGPVGPGVIAGIAADGRGRWTKAAYPCFSLDAPWTHCAGTSEISPTGTATRKVSRIELLSPRTGAVQHRVDLTEPIDDVNPGSRVLRRTAGRFVVDTGQRTFVEVDVSAGQVEPIDAADVIGWCKPPRRSAVLGAPNTERPEVVALLVSRAPCRTTGAAPSVHQVADAIRSGNVDDEEQYVRAGPWRFWIETGGVRGYRAKN